MSGGSISDRRLIAHEDGQVTFWARSRNKTTGNRSRPFSLPGIEFTRRWALHILPKGFTKVRRYGGCSGRLSKDYLERCRALLRIADEASEDARSDEPDVSLSSPTPKCPHCEIPMESVGFIERPSWKKLFEDYSTCPAWHAYWAPVAGSTYHRAREPDG